MHNAYGPNVSHKIVLIYTQAPKVYWMIDHVIRIKTLFYLKLYAQVLLWKIDFQIV